jgi:protein TonB
MDDAGFITGGRTQRSQTLARRRRGRALVGAGVALSVHVALLSILAFNITRTPVQDAYEEPVFTLALVPQARPSPPQAQPDQPAPKPIARPDPPRFTPRQVAATAASPVAPLMAPPPSELAPLRRVAETVVPEAAPSATPAPAGADFQAIVLSKIERARRYPPAARARREEGVATVAFVMTRGGKVTSATLQTSTGSALLDREAIETVRRAQPLPPVPGDVEAPLRLVVRLEFFVK